MKNFTLLERCKNFVASKLLVLLFFVALLPSAKLAAQCTFNNTLYINYTPIYDGVAHTADGCFFGGDLMTMQVVTGATYTFSTCSSTAFDTQITVYNAAGTTVLGYNDDFCGANGFSSQLTVVAGYTGTMNVLIDQWNCASNSGPCMPMEVTSVPAPIVPTPTLPTCVNTPSLSCPATVNISCPAPVTYTAPVGTSPCDGPATASFAPGTAITDNASITSVINQNTFVSGGTLGGQISLQSVCLQINHTYVGDLTAKLTSPSGTQITLFHRPGRPTVGTFGCAGDNLNVCIVAGTGNTLDATATCGNVPAYSGNYTASSANLTSLNNGGLANGNWTLAVSDSAGGDVGTLVSWSLNFTTNTATVQTAGLASGSTFPNGTTTNAFTATDGFGNTASCSFDVVVVDNQSPVISCSAAAPSLCATFASTNVPVNILDVATVTSTLNVSGSGPIADLNVLALNGTHTYVADLTFSLTSPQGTTVVLESGSCSDQDDFSINFDDEAAGGITCPLNAGNTEIPANLLSAFDGENANGTWTLTITDGAGGDVGVLNGWSLQICATGLSNDAGQCGATYTYSTPTATDNCSATVTQTAGLPSGSLFPVGTTTNTFVATDPSGNTASCSFDVVIADVEAPTITCPGTVNATTDAGLCSASNVNLGNPSTSDNCGVATTTNDAPSVYPKGTTTVTWTVTDNSGNTATCTQDVVVTDGEAPVVSCPGTITVNNDAGVCGAVVTFTTPTATDNCNVPSVPAALSTTFAAGNNHRGNMFDIAALNTVTITSFDAHPQANTTIAVYYKTGTHVGFQNTAGAWTLIGSAAVVAQPTGTPTPVPVAVNITIPAGQTYAFYVTSTNTGVSLNYTNGTTLGNVFASDANIQFKEGSGLEYPFSGSPFTPRVWNGIIHYSLAGAALSVTQTAGLASGATFPVGTTTNTFSSTDAAGNTGSCSFDVIVTDNEVPVISACATDISVSADAGVCGATGVVLGTPTFTDNCPGATASNDAPSTFPVGTTTVTWTVTDATGNVSSPCTQVVTVTDDEDPTITCPADVSVSADAGVCSASNVSLGNPTTADNCGVATTTNDAPVSFSLGTTTVTWTVTDNSGNTATCTQTVTVTDDEDPTITCPADVSVSADAGICSASNVSLGNPTTGDNCGVASTSNDAPVSFSLGTTTVTWTVTDNNGNTATCTQTVTVTDDEDPTITCPADVSVSADAGVCSASNVSLGNPTTGDNCGVATTTNDAPVSFSVGTTTVTWTVTDNSGNTATCTQTVTVTDDENPSITCSAQSLNTDAGVCGAGSSSLTAPTTSDNCGVATVSNDAPVTLPVGTTTVTWTVTDVNGNSATCAQTVTVTDNELPTITCPSAVSTNPDAGSCDATNVALGSPTTADNCGVATTTNDAPSSFPTGNTTVTWTVTDANGNTATCTQIVTVVDNIIPTITCPATVSVNADSGICTASNVSLGTPTTGDNCSVASVTNDAPVTFPLGSTTVTWTVTDASGNTSSCGQTVTVSDAENPTITCPADVTTSGCGPTSVTLGTPTTADNCSVATTTNDAPALFPLGTTTVTWTVTDGSGNTATCTQTVTVNGGVDTSLTLTGTTYTANAAGATYQWFDCTNNTNVPSATGQSFTPTASGSYALIITQGACSDTSACFPVVVIGINNVAMDATLKVFPNPATEELNVQVRGTLEGTSKVQLFDAAGRLVRDLVYENMNGTYPVSLTNLAADVYQLRITTAQGIWNTKVMKVN